MTISTKLKEWTDDWYKRRGIIVHVRIEYTQTNAHCHEFSCTGYNSKTGKPLHDTTTSWSMSRALRQMMGGTIP